MTTSLSRVDRRFGPIHKTWSAPAGAEVDPWIAIYSLQRSMDQPFVQHARGRKPVCDQCSVARMDRSINIEAIHGSTFCFRWTAPSFLGQSKTSIHSRQ